MLATWHSVGKINISRVLGFIYIWNKSWRRLVFLKFFVFREKMGP